MPVINQIKQQTRRPNRRNVYLDGVLAFACHVNVIARFRLREGMTLTFEQVRQIEQGEVRQECVDEALRFLGRRLHGRAELERKLTRAHYPVPMVEDVLDDLTRLGYIDDARFARTRALSSAQHKHHGRRRARLELIKSGVSPEAVEKALEAVYLPGEALIAARALAARQAARLRRLDPVVARRRLAGMLQRRGFEVDAVRSILDEFISDSDQRYTDGT